MSNCSIQRLEDYEAHLRKFPAELDSLFHQLLVGVTWFFRDPDAFRMLAGTLSKTIMLHRPAEAVVRVWIAGCSTGEEAYSIAILLTEVRDALLSTCRLQVFATDIDARAIATARAGAYASEISSLIPPDRLKSCFTALPDGGHRINKSIRDEVVFSVHSLLKDPPFSKLDLIVCRNVLIYLDAKAQNRIFSLFHASLKPSGILMLGSSESVGDQQRLFIALDRKAKIYQRRVTGRAIKSAGSDAGVGTPPVHTAGIVEPLVPVVPNAGKSPPTIASHQQELRAQELE
jgi:two-component system CheB/CheR fusion protein